MPGQFRNAQAIDAGPDAGGIGDGANVFPRVLIVSGVANSGLGFNLRADPAGRAGSRSSEHGPLRLQIKCVVRERVVAFHHVGQVDARESLFE